MPSHPAPSGAPRWPVLWALVCGVLVAHLWLVGGGLPTDGFGAPAQQTADGGWATTPPANPPTDVATPSLARPPVVTVSRARWIAPPPPPAAPVLAEPATAPPPKPRRPRKPRLPAPAAAKDDGAPPTPPLTDEAVAIAPSPQEPSLPPPVTPVEAPAEAPVEAPAEARVEAPPPSEAEATAPSLSANDSETVTVTVTAVTTASDTPTTTPADGAPPAVSPTVSIQLAPAQVAPSIDLDYDLRGQAKGLNYSADAQLHWENDGQRYRARLDISAFLMGSRVQTSEGSVGPNGLAPERFGDQRRRSEKAAHFDAASGRIRFSNNAPDAAWAPGAQDRLSMFLQLAALFQAQPTAYPPGSRIGLLVAGTGSAEQWSFQVGAPETLTLPAGEVSAVRLLRPPRHAYDSTVEIWLAPALQHLPVRIRLTEENGSYADQQLRQLPPVIQ